ncbi:hypothetical protein K449DRAFT_75435 [Hypoxylon sp. EC38]|nr:hypothetical protein K449DRAFT_75435 [Hypoxylon sp. EC38]
MRKHTASKTQIINIYTKLLRINEYKHHPWLKSNLSLFFSLTFFSYSPFILDVLK